MSRPIEKIHDGCGGFLSIAVDLQIVTGGNALYIMSIYEAENYRYTPALTWADFPARQTVEGKEYTIWAKAAGDVFNNAPNNKHLRDFADVRSLDFRLEDNDPDAFFRNTISLAHAANVWLPEPVTMGNRGATCVEAYACVVDEDYSDSDPF